MKVYVLKQITGIEQDEYITQVIGVFDKPKTGRKWLDALLEVDTKGKWHKNKNDSRTLSCVPPCIYVLQEFKFIKDKNWDKD